MLCLTNKFPFAACTNQEIMVKSFNSNFNCVCQINLPSDVKENKDNYIFKYSENDTIKDGMGTEIFAVRFFNLNLWRASSILKKGRPNED